MTGSPLGDDDLMVRLRAANPIQPSTVGAAGRSMRGEALFKSVLAGTAVAPRPWWRRRGLLLPAAGAVVLAAGGGGYVAAVQQPSQAITVSCFAGPSLSSYQAAAQLGSSSDPLAGCAALASSGALGAPSNSPLVACILPSGGIGVFPGDDVLCTRLDLPRALSPAPGSQAVGALALTLENTFGSRCVGLAVAERIVASDLALGGLTGWRVVVHPSTSTQPASCAVAGLVPDTKVVGLALAPRPLAGGQPVGG
ncbi:MAG: hypothetical protein JWM85_3556 [Acidimicrobiaceae bacterium]|nr:hypothetical protein [Acidimicrobiaceae bacterium]